MGAGDPCEQVPKLENHDITNAVRLWRDCSKIDNNYREHRLKKTISY